MHKTQQEADEALAKIKEALRGGECSLAILPLLLRPGVAVQVKVKSRKIGPLLLPPDNGTVADTLTMIGHWITQESDELPTKQEMREQCIAWEALRLGDADLAITEVNAWDDRGELEELHVLWLKNRARRGDCGIAPETIRAANAEYHRNG